MRRKVCEFLIVAMVAGASGALVSQGPWNREASAQERKQEKVVQAERYELLDTDGKVQAVWSIGKEGLPALTFRSKDGKPLLTLGAADSNTNGLWIYDGDGKQRIVLGVKNSTPIVGLCDGEEQSRVAILVSKQGAPSVFLYSGKGKTRMALAVEKDTPHMSLYNQDGKLSATLYEKETGPGFVLCDSEGIRRARLEVDEQGEPSLGLMPGRDPKKWWRAP